MMPVGEGGKNDAENNGEEGPELRPRPEIMKELREDIQGILLRAGLQKLSDFTVVKENGLKDYIDIQIRNGSSMHKGGDGVRKAVWEKMEPALMKAEEFETAITLEPAQQLERVRVYLGKEIELRRKQPKKEKPVTEETQEEIPVQPLAEPVAEVRQETQETQEIQLEGPYDLTVLNSLRDKLIGLLDRDKDLVDEAHFEIDLPKPYSLKITFFPRSTLKTSAIKMKMLGDYFMEKFGADAVDPYFPIEVSKMKESNSSPLVLNLGGAYRKLKPDTHGQSS